MICPPDMQTGRAGCIQGAMRIIGLPRTRLHREGTGPYIVERVDTTYGTEGDFAPPDIFVGFLSYLSNP